MSAGSPTFEFARSDQKAVATVVLGDATSVLGDIPDNSFDLTFTSPPYEDARLYGEGTKPLRGQAWVDWAVPVFRQCVRVTRGLVCWVVAGRTRKFRWSAVPALLAADLHRSGIFLRDTRVYFRRGICGSGGPDDWRHDHEWIIAASKGRLPWADPTASGKPPKYGPGGEMSHRMRNGQRVHHPGRRARGKTERQVYVPPKLANPGNVIHCKVGGGHLGSKIAHENEAPFPESLVEPFIRCFCPPGGVVLDPFAGSGTTAAVALRLGRSSLSVDVRPSQAEIMSRRLMEAGRRAGET